MEISRGSVRNESTWTAEPEVTYADRSWVRRAVWLRLHGRSQPSRASMP